jgi:MFS family permease
LRALRFRNYRLFFAGQGISLIGSWMQMIAVPWLVWDLTKSAWWLGLVSFWSRVPQAVIMPLAGVMVDRWNRHRVVVICQVLAMVQAAALGWLTMAGRITMGEVIWLNVGLGVVSSFEMPARQAFLIEMIEDRADLPNAIALNSSMFNGARLIGPAIAGLIMAWWGAGWCFMLNAISYLAVIWALLVMTLHPAAERDRQPKVLDGLRQGVAYCWRMEPIRVLIGLIALVSLMGTPYMVLLPKYASEILHTAQAGYGMLMGATGVGALGGALYLASRTSVIGLDRLIPKATVVFSLGLVGLACSHWLALSVLLMVLTGGAMMVQMASGNTLLQSIIDDDMRGRVMSLWMLAFAGTAPLGSLLAGTLADRFGVPYTILVGGLVSLLAGLVFLARLKQFEALVLPRLAAKNIRPAEGLSDSD